MSDDVYYDELITPLNNLMAEIMGWEVASDEDTGQLSWESGLVTQIEKKEKWRPDIDLIQAMMVVEKMMADGYYVCLKCYGQDEYEAHVLPSVEGWSIDVIPSRAICRAIATAYLEKRDGLTDGQPNNESWF